MAKHGWWGRAGGLLFVAAAPAWGAAAAQEVIPAPRLGVVGGAFVYDLQGEGTAGILGLRLSLPVHRYAAVEAGLHFARYRAEIVREDESLHTPDVPLLLVDFQIQGRYPLGRLAPYVGVGAGGALDFRDEREGEKFVDLTYTASAGVHADLPGPFEALGEVRLRGVGRIEHDVTELVAGVALVF